MRTLRRFSPYLFLHSESLPFVITGWRIVLTGFSILPGSVLYAESPEPFSLLLLPAGIITL